jgi:LmbE family N-acetylglucosaminyl deacetylase
MRNFIFILFLLSFHVGRSQQPSLDAAEIQKELDKLGVLNRVLYVAAHPDDENTRLIAYLSQGKNIETAYCSLTRGDGGQNLIGDEKGELLGIIRTQELLEARKIDGGIQYFTRAIDFGYSKNPAETFLHWDKDSLLADMVRVIRKFKPDVMITRFPPDERAGHGHHTVSAIIAQEAFDAAADPTKFQETVKEFGVWQVQKLYWNESSWWNKTIAAHEDEYVVVNIGEFDPVLGVSYAEIASRSRSQHQSQGFGMAVQRGDTKEYLKLVKGDSSETDPVQKITRTWQDVEGGKTIYKKWKKVLQSYQIEKPSESIPGLIDLYFSVVNMPENTYKNSKLESIKNLIASCGGLWLDLRSQDPYIVKNEPFGWEALAISQSNYSFNLESVTVLGKTYTVPRDLTNSYTRISDTSLAPDVTTGPYWLENLSNPNWFEARDRSQIGNPENGPVVDATFTFTTDQGTIEFTRSLKYQWTDRVRGELYRPAEIVNPVAIEFAKKIALSSSHEILARVTAYKNVENVSVRLFWEDGGRHSTEPQTIRSIQKGQTIPIVFQADTSSSSTVKMWAEISLPDSTSYTKSVIEISYPHIHTQIAMADAQMIRINEDIQILRKEIGYIMGSGDEIPEALIEMGCHVTPLDPGEITPELLQKYEGVVVGIRAFNTEENMKSVAPMLNQYVFNGGFVLVQYNTNRGLVTEEIGPYPIALSRNRVTEENAPTIRLQRDHPILKFPNVISDADFENWVQERGLYFAGEWDDNYTPILAWKDTGEEMTKGALLVTEYGKGHYVFTGISFFRQLPAGVTGAFKLFGNLMSYGSNSEKK